MLWGKRFPLSGNITASNWLEKVSRAPEVRNGNLHHVPETTPLLSEKALTRLIVCQLKNG
jgi:hypothetical protein